MLKAAHIPVVGIDPTEELLAQARIRDPNGDYQIARAELLPFPDASFDLVVTYLTLIDIADFRAALKEMVRVLKPNGVLLIANLNSFISLGVLEHYLRYYTKRLKNQKWCKGLIYIDAFAGLGRAEVRKRDEATAAGLFDINTREDVYTRKFINGSPRVALPILDKFARYVFIDQEPGRVEALNKLKEEFAKTHRIRILAGDANNELRSILLSGIQWQSYRAVVFLDPFGMQVPWDTIRALAQTQAIEVLINFPLGMAIQRVLPRSGELSAERRKSLDTFFGSSEWWAQVYEESTGLFGAKTTKLRDSSERLLKWYRGRLKDTFGYVSTARLIKNTRGAHLYYLLWAGPHEAGLKGANYILKMGDPISTQTRRRKE